MSINRTRRRVVLWGIIVAAIGGAVFVFLRPARPVNILLITLDTTRADRLGCYGYAAAETPHLDALALRGVLFERAYAPAPMTAPSHASVFTGLWPPEHGVVTNGQASLQQGIPTLAESLANEGYDAAAFVAAFVLQSKFGFDRGFQVYDDDLSAAEGGGDILHRYRDGKYVVDSAVGWLKKHRQSSAESPFFCWVHLYDPHEPYLLHHEEFGNRFNKRPYDGEIAYTDRLVGRILNALEVHGLTQNTVVVIVGDHGESLGEHGEKTHGYMLHESTLHVPLIIADPRHPSAAGRRVATPVSLVDLFPTLLETGSAPAPEAVAGRSLQPALDGQPLESRVCYSQTEEPYLQAFWSPLQGLTTERWRYVRSTRPELYDLQADPHELVNLADRQPETVRQLETELATLEATFKTKSSTQVALTSRERQALESLGYVGAPVASAPKASRSNQPLPDIKDMIGLLSELEEAGEFMDEQDYDAAIAILQRLVRQSPSLLRAKLNLGTCHLMEKNYAEAVRCLEATLEIDLNCDRAHDMLAFAYLKLRKLDLAEQHCLKMLELSPNSENAHLFLGEIAQRRGDLALAFGCYSRVLQINPRHVPAREALEALRAAGVTR